ncbi:hypothetical protein niasHT_012497 [Heterodera trifolii]|uniref:DNA helicase Pif1-like 2B domain-containing protein n=1 Tax=Heterodera trifolii TaxID=157864 RepID=A0ABD2LCG8_9BILA
MPSKDRSRKELERKRWRGSTDHVNDNERNWLWTKQNPLANADAIANNAVLCPTNNDVQYINEIALARMSGDAKGFPSIDEPLEPNEELHNFRTDFNIEAVHNEMPSGMPPHKMVLKVGTPVMLVRNLDVTQGLCNGTRLQVMRMAEDCLFCRILTGPRADAGHVIVLPRIQFEYGRGRHHRGLRFRRLQFPVRLCFAMTINKAQGQTLQRMALVLNGKQCFSHGQVYVAMSRVTKMDGIKVFAPYCQSGDETFINNVVYHELLDNIVGTTHQQLLYLNVMDVDFHSEGASKDGDSVDDFANESRRESGDVLLLETGDENFLSREVTSGDDLQKSEVEHLEEIKKTFLLAKVNYKSEIDHNEENIATQKLAIVEQAGALIKEELFVHEAAKKKVYAKLLPEKLRLADLKNKLVLLKAKCTKEAIVCAGALDEISELAQEIQKQSDFLTKIESSCTQQVRAETARYQQKRVDIWMEALPSLEQLEGSKNEFHNHRFHQLQQLAKKMNAIRKSLNKEGSLIQPKNHLDTLAQSHIDIVGMDSIVMNEASLDVLEIEI